jgi:hypothetical protein
MKKKLPLNLDQIKLISACLLLNYKKRGHLLLKCFALNVKVNNYIQLMLFYFDNV